MTIRVVFLGLLLSAGSSRAQQASWSEQQRQVAATERAFAKTMADRDLAAFTTFLSREAIFFTGPAPLRGLESVTASWKAFFETS